MTIKARTPGAPGAGRDRKDPPLEPPEKHSPATPGFQTSGFQNQWGVRVVLGDRFLVFEAPT